MELHNEEYKGYKIIVSYDEYAYSPRENSNVSCLFLNHRRYDFEWYDSGISKGDNIDELVKELKASGYKYIMPVYAYIHSDVSLSLGSFSCPFDSGVLGVIATTDGNIREMGIKKHKKNIIKAYEYELDLYNKYINGYVYAYETLKANTCKCCNNVSYDIIDSCVSIYDDDDALETAKSYIDTITD